MLGHLEWPRFWGSNARPPPSYPVLPKQGLGSEVAHGFSPVWEGRPWHPVAFEDMIRIGGSKKTWGILQSMHLAAFFVSHVLLSGG